MLPKGSCILMLYILWMSFSWIYGTYTNISFYLALHCPLLLIHFLYDALLSGYGDISQGLHPSTWCRITNQTCGWWCLPHFLPHWKNCQEGHHHNKLPELCRETNIKEGDICLLLQKPGKAFHVGSYRSLLYLLHMLHRATVALLLDAVAWVLNHLTVSIMDRIVNHSSCLQFI